MGRPCAPLHPNPADYPACGFCREVLAGKPDRPSAARPGAVGTAQTPPADRDVWKRGRCKYQSQEVLEVQQCKTCARTLSVDIHPCSIHGRCSLEVLTKTPGVHVCGICPDFQRLADLGRIVLINLDRRPDRLQAFEERARSVGLPAWQRHPAVDGREVPAPHDWKGGRGAWGCRASHMQILEKAITDKVPVLTVLEDDCDFVPDFMARLQVLWEGLPNDWRAVLLGYQQRGPTIPQQVAPGILRIMNAQRTHAYVLRGQKTMQDVYRVWSESKTHIDHASYRWQQHLATYAPEGPLCGQAAGRSDITGKDHEARDWS